MQVIVPFAGPSWPIHAVKLALKQDGVEPRFEHMTDDGSYFKLVEGLWQERKGFILVEHDIVVWPGAIHELEHCPESWCTIPYYCSMGWIVDGLGCTKFSADLMEAFPNFLHEPFPECCRHDRYYCGLDRLIAHRFTDLGIKPHVHAPGVVNLNERWAC